MALPQTNAAMPQSRAAERGLHLPPPQTFDILPALHELLARIDHASPEGTVTGLMDPPESSSKVGALYTDLAPLEPKELPNETLQIKAKIRSALKALEKLPDMDRTVEEQQLEIDELESRIARQSAMISKLSEVAKGVQERLG